MRRWLHGKLEESIWFRSRCKHETAELVWFGDRGKSCVWLYFCPECAATRGMAMWGGDGRVDPEIRGAPVGAGIAGSTSEGEK